MTGAVRGRCRFLGTIIYFKLIVFVAAATTIRKFEATRGRCIGEYSCSRHQVVPQVLDISCRLPRHTGKMRRATRHLRYDASPRAARGRHVVGNLSVTMKAVRRAQFQALFSREGAASAQYHGHCLWAMEAGG